MPHIVPPLLQPQGQALEGTEIIFKNRDGGISDFLNLCYPFLKDTFFQRKLWRVTWEPSQSRHLPHPKSTSAGNGSFASSGAAPCEQQHFHDMESWQGPGCKHKNTGKQQGIGEVLRFKHQKQLLEPSWSHITVKLGQMEGFGYTARVGVQSQGSRRQWGHSVQRGGHLPAEVRGITLKYNPVLHTLIPRGAEEWSLQNILKRRQVRSNMAQKETVGIVILEPGRPRFGPS